MKLQRDPFLPRDLPGLVRQLTTLWHGLVTWSGTLGMDAPANGEVPVWDATTGSFQPGPAIADSGWQAIAPANGWAAFAGYTTPAYRKVGDRVYLRGLFSGGTATDGTTLLTLAAGYRPAGQERFAMSTSATQPARAVISTAGVVTIFGVAAGATIGISGIAFSTT
jgi:hypothetical protein